MKAKRIYRIAGIALAAVMAATCVFNIDTISVSPNPVANSTVTVSTHSTLKINTSGNTRVVVGLLVPKYMDVASNANVTFSTTGRDKAQPGEADIVGGTMHAVDPSQTDPKTGMPWAAAFMSNYGDMGNTGVVEWVVFESDEEYVLVDNDSNEFTMDIAATFNTGEKNIKFFVGMAFCGTKDGFTPDPDWGNHYSNGVKATVDITGGSGNEDYTVFHLTSTYPLSFRYNDIFSVIFTSKLEGLETALYGADNVYMLGSVKLADGSVHELNTVSEQTLMKRTGDASYQKYIHLVDYFGLEKGAKIEEFSVYFVNADKKIVVKDPSTDDSFKIYQADK